MYLTPVRVWPQHPQQAYCSDMRAGRDDKTKTYRGDSGTTCRVDGNGSSKRAWLVPGDSAFRPHRRRIWTWWTAVILDARLNSRGDIELCTVQSMYREDLAAALWVELPA